MTTGVHVMLTCATEFVHCCEILPKGRDYSVASSLGEETEYLWSNPSTKKVISPLTLAWVETAYKTSYMARNNFLSSSLLCELYSSRTIVKIHAQQSVTEMLAADIKPGMLEM
ncbi:hypothetical protein BsWGS_25961 [Bradybaena similaris]